MAPSQPPTQPHPWSSDTLADVVQPVCAACTLSFTADTLSRWPQLLPAATNVSGFWEPAPLLACCAYAKAAVRRRPNNAGSSNLRVV